MTTSGRKKKNGLTELQIERLHHLLLARRDQLMENILQRSRNYPRIAEGQNTENFEQAAINQRQAVTLRILDKEAKLLERIEHALSKFGTGKYGLCEATNEPIGYPRLSIVPWARYCISYKEQREREQYTESARLAGR